MEQNELFIYYQIGGTLKFYNSFKTSGNNDVLYFILAVCKQYNINPALQMLTISGWVEEDSALFDLLNNYIPNIKLENNRQMILAGNQDQSQLKPHYYFAHFAASLCA
ncbi:MAG: DUF3822 family protein [Saprospiraceae bacterium]|nr:DUF3822 family protein [Saprospiraceae bacterium]